LRREDPGPITDEKRQKTDKEQVEVEKRQQRQSDSPEVQKDEVSEGRNRKLCWPL
jgi:hypothetical protein